MDADCLNTIGLTLDIIGVGLLFRFGLPEAFMAKIKLRPADENQWNRYFYLSRIALILVILGFALQIVSNHLQS